MESCRARCLLRLFVIGAYPIAISKKAYCSFDVPLTYSKSCFNNRMQDVLRLSLFPFMFRRFEQSRRAGNWTPCSFLRSSRMVDELDGVDLDGRGAIVLCMIGLR